MSVTLVISLHRWRGITILIKIDKSLFLIFSWLKIINIYCNKQKFNIVFNNIYYKQLIAK